MNNVTPRMPPPHTEPREECWCYELAGSDHPLEPPRPSWEAGAEALAADIRATAPFYKLGAQTIAREHADDGAAPLEPPRLNSETWETFTNADGGVGIRRAKGGTAQSPLDVERLRAELDRLEAEECYNDAYRVALNDVRALLGAASERPEAPDRHWLDIEK